MLISLLVKLASVGGFVKDISLSTKSPEMQNIWLYSALYFFGHDVLALVTSTITRLRQFLSYIPVIYIYCNLDSFDSEYI